MIDWTRCRTAPYDHQKLGVVKLLQEPAFALFDQVGAGKSKQVIDAACALYEAGKIDTLLVVCPAAVRSVWADPDPVLGEVAKHVWDWRIATISEYHRKTKRLPVGMSLQVVVTNYEFLRRAERLDPLIEWASTRRVWLVLDESWAVKSYKAQQTKAMLKLRRVCERATILNGTPGDPGELFSQFQILNPAILGHKSFFSFRAKYARMGGFMNKQVVGWDHMEEFQRKIAPYALRRLTHECVDLPPVSYTQIDARLTPTTWAHYTAMRDELVTWLSNNEVCTAEQAGVRVMRLAQLTAGFLGGVQELDPQLYTDGLMPIPVSGIREIGREKLDALLEWLGQNWPEGNKLVVWGRFRAEIERAATELENVALKLLPMNTPQDTLGLVVRKLYGGQSPEERAEIKQLLAPGGSSRASIVVGSPQAGGSGLNFAAASLAVYLTNGFSLKDRLQSEGRLDRPGQTRPVLYVDVVATGPNGERTLDHTVVAALRRKQNLSDLTASAWREELLKEAA